MQILSPPQSFGARFVVLLFVASIATWAVALPERLAAVQTLLAHSAGFIATLTGSSNRVLGDQIYVKGLTLDIHYECTGAYVLLILATFVVAYPARWSQRIIGLLIGIAALTLVNILRISVLVRVAEIRPDLFPYFHEYVWQGVFLVLVIVYAMRWVERLR
jgi:exosortase/archaeosortase family protein